MILFIEKAQDKLGVLRNTDFTIVSHHKKSCNNYPVTINTGETPPKAEDLIDVKLWNQKHGRNFIILGIMLWCIFVVGGYVLSRINGVIAIIIIIAAVLFEFFGLIFSTKK